MHKLDAQRERGAAGDVGDGSKPVVRKHPPTTLELRRLEKARREESSSPIRVPPVQPTANKPTAIKTYVRTNFNLTSLFFKVRKLVQGDVLRRSERVLHLSATVPTAATDSMVRLPRLSITVLFFRIKIVQQLDCVHSKGHFDHVGSALGSADIRCVALDQLLMVSRHRHCINEVQRAGTEASFFQVFLF